MGLSKLLTFPLRLPDHFCNYSPDPLNLEVFKKLLRRTPNEALLVLYLCTIPRFAASMKV